VFTRGYKSFYSIDNPLLLIKKPFSKMPMPNSCPQTGLYLYPWTKKPVLLDRSTVAIQKPFY
jgi:hypothetical protein